MKDQILSIAREIEPELIRIRRAIHCNPELSLQEYATAKLIADTLRSLEGVEVREHLAEGTGVAGILRGEAGDGRCLMLRADMDALAVQEPEGLPFASRNPGVMHACGHDAHTAWLLGAAMILSRLRGQLRGTVKFVFQPGEEVGAGADALIKRDHILENPAVDAAFAVHAWPDLPAGQIGIAEQIPFGCAGHFEVTIQGKGGHGSWPYRCVNPISSAVQICTLLSSIVSEQVDSAEPRVISIGSIHAGERSNIIPETCTMSGTIRAADAAVLQQLGEKIEHVIRSVTGMNGASCRLDLHAAGSPVINDPGLVALAAQSVRDLLGEEHCTILRKKHLGGENFAEYSSRVPGCYLFSGIATEQNAGRFGLHSPRFELAEEVIAPTAAALAAISLDFLIK